MSDLDLSPIAGAVSIPLLWLILALALVAALKALLPGLTGRAGEAAVGRALRRRFPETFDDAIFPDGRGGLTQIDHLVLTPRGVLVVETKTYRGTVLGRAQEPTWTQVLGGRRSSFQNPLRQSYAHRKAVEALEPGVAVHELVVFAGDARFPKGLPEGACTLSGIDRALAPFAEGEVSSELLAAWHRLLGARRTDRDARKAHLNGLRARFGGSRRTARPAIAVAALAAAALVAFAVFRGPDVPPDRMHFERAAVQANTARAPAIGPPSSLPRPPPPPARASANAAPVVSPPVFSAPPKPPLVPNKSVATIEWADPGAEDDACALARVAALIERTAESQRARDRACGDGAAAETP